LTETVVKNTPKHTTDDLGIIIFRGACPCTPQNIVSLSGSSSHLSYFSVAQIRGSSH